MAVLIQRCIAFSTTPLYCCALGGEYCKAIPMVEQMSRKSLLVQSESQSPRTLRILVPALWARSTIHRLKTATASDLRRRA